MTETKGGQSGTGMGWWLFILFLMLIGQADYQKKFNDEHREYTKRRADSLQIQVNQQRVRITDLEAQLNAARKD